MRRSQAAAHQLNVLLPHSGVRGRRDRIIQTIGAVTTKDYCANDQEEIFRSLIYGIAGLCQMLVPLFSVILFVICLVKTII